MDQRIYHVGRPNIGNQEAFLERVHDILERKWLSNEGRYCREFEASLCKLLGVKHSVAMCNATVGLEIAIRALGLKGEVIVPSFTFIATAHALQWQEITPVFCDIDPATHNIDPQRVEEMITPRTTGILAVHCWGRPCDVDALAKIAQRHGLKLAFDAAHAFGCSHAGTMIGSFGDAEVFSFHATKFINTLEGGVVATNDDELAQKMRLMRNFGFVDYDRVDYLGTNGKMNEVSAAMGVTNLESLREFIQVNQGNYLAYRSGLADIPGLALIKYEGPEQCNYQYIVVEVDPDACPLTRDRLIKVLHAENVIARRYLDPGCHRMEPYRSLFPHAGMLLPETERLGERVLCLPTGTSMSIEDVNTVCQIIRTAVTKARNKSNPGVEATTSSTS